jgi:hypothetical protein
MSYRSNRIKKSLRSCRERAQQRLVQSPPGSVDAFTDAVFEAEGFGDMSGTDLREKVREVVAAHMGRWRQA